MILLDTCALLWWTLDPEKLSDEATDVCDRIYSNGAFISSISIWEIGIKIKKNKLDINTDIREYTDRVKALNIIEIIPVDEDIWVESVSLEWEHRDPADRTIVATAKLRNVPIVTSDRIIREFYQRVIW
ncbi:MAG: type II toxin-antitoxin system VapC family toxin [Desulfobacteraceae bacterium]|nr:type II toxin-antitoxin system VapC family toxin [Desulfobacteraceae bacterium]